MKIINDLGKQASGIPSDKIGSVIEEQVTQAVTQRRSFERHWYENNMFDDGYHFKVVSKKTGRVIDTVGKLSGYTERAIPRASLQIRGVSNLLFSAEPYPVVYPKRVTREDFMDTLGQFDEQSFMDEIKKNKAVARKQGIYLTTEWEDNDVDIKLIDMMLKAAKNSISYLQIYSENGQIKYKVRDAFDVIVYGHHSSLNECPFVTITEARDINEVKNDPMFDAAMASKLTADNKYATSEVKDAYMRARYGTRTSDKPTIMVKESYMREELTDENWRKVIKMTQNDSGVMDGKSRGDKVMRHPFSAGGVTLKDEYIDYDNYPFAYFRFEPGALYQKPFIENFIAQNKSLDIVMTRLEKWVNSMVVGVYQKRKGENMQVSNFPGGQMVEYETTPLAQMNTSSVGNTPFNVVSLLDKYIEEQGASTSALSKIPDGVKSGNAIESLKASEYANLKIATKMLKKCIKQIAELTLERAHKDIMEPKEIEYMNDSEPDYFDVIGQRGYDLSQQVNKALPNDIVPIDKSVRVRIEIEPGMGLTMEGKRLAMKDLIANMIQLATAGYVGPDALKIMVKQYLDTYGFGSTQEFMEALDAQTTDSVDEAMMQKIKISMLETLKDAGVVGPEQDKKLIDSTKVGMMEVLKDTGMLNKPKETAAKEPSKSISFKDLPPEGQAQLAEQAGIRINPRQVFENQLRQKELNKPEPKPNGQPGTTG